MRGQKLLVSRLSKKVSDVERLLLPRRWQLLGELILVHIPCGINHLKYEIGQGLLELYPRCKSVIWDKGIEGQFRRPNIEVIAGSGTKTIHTENKCKFALDVSRVMFSSGNFAERIRMSKLGFAEDVLDMFSGIGQFPVPMATYSKPRTITAIEINEDAFFYLKKNIRLNDACDIIEPLLGDCAKESPVSDFDRVIMGSFEAFNYLENGIKAIKPGGILHYHETVPIQLAYTRPLARVVEAAKKIGKNVEALEIKKVKNFSPGIWHVVLDARIN
ncbi:MAG TPA: class I SAM-dependent methyltransferase family protein [Candidatus Acidoferrales bacterium]|nr:class I SAM-dependent methyltransferase family protein [Candidatus Acidoferrales bacterium]